MHPGVLRMCFTAAEPSGQPESTEVMDTAVDIEITKPQ